MKTIHRSGRNLPVKLRSNSKTEKLKDQLKNPIQESELLKSLGIRTFEQEYKRLMKQNDSQDFSGTTSSYAMLRAQLAMMIQALPILEEQLHKYKNERAAYAIVALSNHARELAHDLRSFGDQSELIQRIQEQVIRKSLGSLVTRIAQDVIATKASLYENLPPKSASRVAKKLTALQRRLADHVREVDGESLDTITRLLTIR